MSPLPEGVAAHFSRFLTSDPDRLHLAAHSHHPWPDVSFEAHQRAWLDAARMHDDKWDHVFEEVVPEFQGHVADRLALPDPATIAFAPNTHELVSRLLSCLPRPARVLTTDAEFHSFERQVQRLEEDGDLQVHRVAAEPYGSLHERLAEAASSGDHDLVFFSQVFFDSALAVADLEEIVRAVPDERTFVVVDGYHGFMALPTDLSTIADRAFYIAGGYKYAMAGEGAVFMHCPSGYGTRPPDTGWFAAFSALESGVDERVAYAQDGSRFLGSTFDPSGLYRFNAVQRWLNELGVTVDDIHAHVHGLQERFLSALDEASSSVLSPIDLLPPRELHPRGHFLTFRRPDAAQIQAELARRGVVTDHRGDRLRIGFGVYHDRSDVDELLRRLASLST